MKYLGEGIKYLPKNLQKFTLGLYNNKLGEKTINLKWLGEILKNLPKNLQNLILDL